MAWPPSKAFFATFCLAVTQHHHDEGWAAHPPQFSFSSFQFPWQLPVLVLFLLSCPRPLFLGLPGCYAFPMLYYIKITLFFSHLHPVKLLHNEHSSSSADLLNPPKKPATNPLPCWLLRWCLWALLKPLPTGSTAPSSAFLTLTRLRSLYFPAKPCLRLHLHVSVCWPSWTSLNWKLSQIHLGFFSQFIQYTSQGIQRRAVYPDTKRDFKVLREHEIISLIPCFITDCKQHSLAIPTENICFKISPRI